MGYESRLRRTRRSLRSGVVVGNLTIAQANYLYREAKGRVAPAPGPWPLEVVTDRATGKPVSVPMQRHLRWHSQPARFPHREGCPQSGVCRVGCVVR